MVRLPIQQRLRDAAAGLNTGGYISGYRGSPLGRYDIELWAAEEYLKKQNIVFRAGVNEDLAATAIWGASMSAPFRCQGRWYSASGMAKGRGSIAPAIRSSCRPGRCRTARWRDRAGRRRSRCQSPVPWPTTPDLNFVAAGIPLLYPANAQELLDLGLHGIAMSRYSGCWVGMKVVTDVVEGGGSVLVSPTSPGDRAAALPTEPVGGHNSRAIDAPLPQEERLYHRKHWRCWPTPGASGSTGSKRSSRLLGRGSACWPRARPGGTFARRWWRWA
ncbi:MAG: hypothetical protein R3E68_05035 [Burkholderiaceae bacterium]